MEQGIKQELDNKLKMEVDFHHKVAYKFERAYRICKR
jgi:hypothetical protein